ncbi:MAG: transglutaminase-like domain-containing protein [Pseudomonadales bacterium]|nr:transglutaminase-like domain-containing protein [Pseudomonadales bacterium]
MTVLSGSIAAVLGCVLACVFIDTSLHRSPLKHFQTYSLLAALFVTGLIGVSIAAVLVDSSLIANVLSPITAFNSSEFVAWLSLSFAITCSLRVLAHRTSYGAVIEIVFVAAAFIVTLAAHRNGMIHRPFFIGDFALIRGIDPATILMAFGCGAVLALAALLMMESNQRRLPYHFAVLGLLCFSLVGYIRLFGLPTPNLTNDLGLTGQEQSGGSRQQENPFRDGENTAEDKEAPVAVVVFRDDYEPLNGSYYFRESAYSQFNGVMLDYTTREDMDRDLIEQFTSTEIEADVLPEAADQRIPVRTSIGMLVPHRNPFGLVSPVSYENVANPNNLRFKRTYDAYSMAPEYDFEYLLGRELGREEWSEEVWDEYLTLPADPRYQQLAESLIANLRPEYADDPFAKAWAIKSYLDENGIYSLKNEHAYEADPAASFLFGDLTGYCMHFAFAATYMYRSLGIPARVGVGYSVPASNRAGGSALLVQAVHGHAWPEIYFKDIGWVIVDPAPQQTLVDMTTDPQNELQQLLGDMLRDDASFEDFLSAQQNSAFSFQGLLNILYAMVLGAIFLGYAIKSYRLLAPRLGSLEQQHKLSYRAVLDRLAAVGLTRHYGESREDFAARLAGSVPSLSPMTQAHLAVALSGPQKTLPQADWWSQQRASVNGEISANTKSWQRALAILNPFSWLFSR